MNFLFCLLGFTSLLTGFLLPFFVPMTSVDLFGLHLFSLAGAFLSGLGCYIHCLITEY